MSVKYVDFRCDLEDPAGYSENVLSHKVCMRAWVCSQADCRSIYLRQGDYVIIGICLFVCLLAGPPATMW